MMTVILLTGDLTVVSRVQGAACSAGAATRVVSSEAAAVESCRAEAAELVVVDLGMPSLDVESLVVNLKAAMSTPPRVVAFGPHVHEGKLAAAREAGCDEVLSRGQFLGQLAAVLGR